MDADFDGLIKRVFAGDSAAAAQLVRDFEPEIRRIVRFRLRDPQLRRVIDSTDICQSVFAKFFFRAAMGQYEFHSPADLIRLLSKMATNRVIDRYRTEQSQKKLSEARGRQTQFADSGERIDRADAPEAVVEHRELLDGVRQRLSPDEREISRLRLAGKSWLEVSEHMGSSPQALRKRLERACDRIFGELGIVEA